MLIHVHVEDGIILHARSDAERGSSCSGMHAKLMQHMKESHAHQMGPDAQVRDGQIAIVLHRLFDLPRDVAFQSDYAE